MTCWKKATKRTSDNHLHVYVHSLYPQKHVFFPQGIFEMQKQKTKQSLKTTEVHRKEGKEAKPIKVFHVGFLQQA